MPTSLPAEVIIKILPKGIITIPKPIRSQLGFEENSLARISVSKRKMIVEPVRTLPYPVRNYTVKDLKDFLKLDKKESKQLRRQGLL